MSNNPWSERIYKQVIPFLIETLGGFLVAVSIDSFAVNGEFPLTGFSGIAMIFNRLLGMPIGVTILLLNVPLAFLCYRLLGRHFSCAPSVVWSFPPFLSTM